MLMFFFDYLAPAMLLRSHIRIPFWSALKYHLDANLGETPSQDRLDAMSGSINQTLESINDVADKMLSTTDGALRFKDLKACLSKLTQQGGLKDSQSCVMVCDSPQFCTGGFQAVALLVARN